MHNLNDIATEALDIFRIKLSGAVADDARLYELRKRLALASTASHVYLWEAFGDIMSHAQHVLDQAIPPLTELKQSELLARFESWIEQRLQEAASTGPARKNDAQVAARGAVAASGSGVRKAGKKL